MNGDWMNTMILSEDTPKMYYPNIVATRIYGQVVVINPFLTV